MEGTEEEQRNKKLQAGREKLAHFRQRKTKGESSKAQKKAQKRKNKAVHANDVSKKEDSLVQDEYSERVTLSGADDVTIESMNSLLDVSECQDKTTDLEARLKTNDFEVLRKPLHGFQTPLEDNLTPEPHEETKENEYKVAKLEHLMQDQQLKVELLQRKLETSENSVSLLQQELSDRNLEITQLKNKMSGSIRTEFSPTSLQSDIGGGGESSRSSNGMDTESLAALVVDLKERLAESETLRESLRLKIEEQMKAFEMERSAWEQKHNDTVANLTLRLQQAEEMAVQDKDEKERLNQELRNLKNNLRLEAESSQALKLQHERDLQMYDLKLQSLEEDKTKLNQQLSITWKPLDSEERVDIKVIDKDTRVDFRPELEDLKKNLNKVKARKELENSKAMELPIEEDEVATTPALTSMDRYLIPNLSELDTSQEDLSEHSKFELDSDFLLEQSINSTMDGNINLLSSPMPITGVLADGATLGRLLDPESFAVYLSSNTGSNVEAELSPVMTKDLVQKCTILIETLQNKEEMLQRSSEALEEALQKWRDVTSELAVAKLELEKAPKIENWEEQQKMLEEIKSERDDLKTRITDQEQLLREVQEQKSTNEERLSHLVEEKASLVTKLAAVEEELEKTLELYKDLENSHLNLSQNLQKSEMSRESERQEFDNKLNSKGVEQQLLEESIRAKESEFYQREENLQEEVALLRQVKEDLESKLHEEVNRLNADFEKRMDISGESWKEQIALVNEEHKGEVSLLKDAHEKELQKLLSDLSVEKQKLVELQQQLEDMQRTKAEQIQSHNMEMEALRLSLNTLHTAHLELSQSNLVKEKEDALVQLRDQLNNKWAQDLAMLQGKNQFEVEHLRNEHSQALESLREELSKEMLRHQKEHLKEIEHLKKKHVEETSVLEERHQKEVEMSERISEEFEQKLEMLQGEHAEKLDRKSEELRLVEEESVVKLSKLKETISKHYEELEQVREELSDTLKQNEELSRQIDFLSEEHALKISDMQAQQKAAIESLEQDRSRENKDREKCGNQQSELLEQLRKELSQTTKLHSNQMDKLLEKHSHELLNLQEVHSREVADLQDLLALERESKTRQQDETAEKVMQLQMRCEDLEALQKTHLQEKGEWEKQTQQNLETLKSLKVEIIHLQEEHSKALEQHSKDIEEIQEQHVLENEEWEKQRDLHAQELDLLVNQHSQELKRIGEELLQNSLLKQEEHAKQLEQTREECSRQILELQQKHLAEIQSVKDIHRQEREEWKKELDQLLQQIHSNEMQQPTDTDFPESKDLQDQHMKQIKDLQEHQGQMRVFSHQNQLGKVSTLLLDSSYNPTKAIPLELEKQHQNCSGKQIESSEEIHLLWSQIDRSRASRQELNELKEQLLARSTQLEEIERMRKEFEKERLLIKAEHEKEMEELRIYFEQKSISAEETYREELEILHQRLREMNDDEKVEMTPLNCSALSLEESFDSEKLNFLQHLTDQLVEHKEELAYSRLHDEEKHKQELDNLRAALSLQYKEDMINLRNDLSEKYALEIETLKKKQCLELEQLRAKLSEEHIKEITQVQLQYTHESIHLEEKAETQNFGSGHQNLDTERPDKDMKISQLHFSNLHVPLQKLEKNSKMCQTDFDSRSTDERSDQGDGLVQMSQLEILHSLHAKELADVREKMASDLEEVTKRLKIEKENVLKEVEDRCAQISMENAKLQQDLLRETVIRTSSEEYKEVDNDDPKPQAEENFISPTSEKCDQESGDGDLFFKGPEKDTIFLSRLSPINELNACLSELPIHRKKELYSQITELLRKHQEELHARDLGHEAHIQNLEASHLVKLDTLESSYLSEIQKIRDEHALAVEELEKCLCNRLQEKEKEVQEQLEKSRTQWLQQQGQDLHRLRQELASVHMEKFQAMAEELEAAHREDMRQKLEQQLYQLEEEKKRALDILQEEVLKMEAQNQHAVQELRDLHKEEVEHQTIKLQEELKMKTEELHKQELLIAELTSERQALSTELESQSNQQLRYQEEIELLKCQSEMLLEQQIALLKDEFSAEKKSALQELEDHLSAKLRAEHQVEKDHIVKQLEDKNTLVLQLQEKVSDLSKEMDASQSQMDVLVQTRERENQEGENLVSILQLDAQTAQQELKRFQDSCQRLLKIFADVLKSTLVTEDLISKKIGLCLDNSLSQAEDERTHDNMGKPTDVTRLSPDCDTMTEHSLMSTDEGYEVSEYLCDSVLGSLEVGLENEEKIVRMGHRLRAAVERLLDMVTDSTLQLEQTREMQKCLEGEFKSRNQDMAQVVVQNQELLKQLEKETEEKKLLQVELHKSQGLIEGFALEKAALEEAVLSKESSEHQLIVELERAREQLKILTQEPSVFGKEKEVLERLQEVLSGSDIESELLQETERLLKEELELHCQAKQDRANLISQMKMLEMELEEQMARNQDLMKKTNQMTDLQQQIQSLEKQLKSQRHFMDEQAVEREHERDEFQQEIQNLEEQLKQALKNHGDSKAYGLHDWSAQIESLEARVKEKADDCKLLLQGREQLEQQITERNEEIDKMLLRIQELEQAALSNADAAKKCSQLEAEMQKMQKMEKELLQDKEALQQQQYNNVLQISALQSKLDEARHRIPVDGEPDLLLKQELQAEREALQSKEKEAESLVEQLEQFREELMNKTEEVFQLNLQLDIQRKQYEQAIQQTQEEYLRLKDEISTLHSKKAEDTASSTLQLPQALLQEKNQEIDHLNEQILRLRQEATNSQSDEVEELRSLVELLRSDLDRSRKDKEEEVEQLHEVIEKLQQELEQLGPNRHEISDSQESLDQLGLGEVENLQRELRKGAKQCLGRSTTPDSDSEPSSQAKLEALQQELVEKEAEIEVLERNLQNIEQSSRQQEQVLETLQLQHDHLQEECELLRTRYSQREGDNISLSSQLQELQDKLREMDGFLMEKELLVQTLQEQNGADRAEFENKLAKNAVSIETIKGDLQKVQEENVSLQGEMARCSSEQKEREEYQQEVQHLKQVVSDWKERALILTEEVQTQTQEDEFMELQVSPHLVTLKEQLNTAENLASMREADLHGAQTELAKLKIELEELHAECERREAKAQDVLQQLQKREIFVAELQTHSLNLSTQVKKLQEALVSQEAMLALMSGDLPDKNIEDVTHKSDLSRPGKSKSFSESLTDLSTWDSPDMVRKQEEAMHSLRAFTPFSELSIDHSAELMRSKSCNRRPEGRELIGSSSPSLSESNFSAQRASPLRDAEHTDYGSCDDLRSSRDDQMDSEKSEVDYRPEEGSMSKPNYMENLLHLKQKMDSLGSSGLSPQLQRMLNMVHEESCKILELSELPLVKSTLQDGSDLTVKIETWQKEKQSLQETIQSLSSALAQAADKGDKESTTLDWRRDLLQSVQALLESEREYLRLELQSDIRHGSGDKSLLSEKVEHLIKEQEEQKRLVLEHVLSVDRSSLLSEIQDLRSQLRMAHLQNQEKLQKLQDTLTSTEEKGHTREHQLRRQVELLEYKLQQEASIAEDLKGSLSREKERATEQYKLLVQEQSIVSQLRSDLEDKMQEVESVRKSLKEVQNKLQMETSKLRVELESKEKNMSEYIKTVQNESQMEKQRMVEEKSLIQRTLEMTEKSFQEASRSLEEEKKINAKISAALSQEQTFCSNVKKELEIEQSRCRALLAQEHGRLSEVAKELEKEKQHSVSLSNTLTLERGVLEQLRLQHARELSTKEEERQQEHKLVQMLQSELEIERKRARELAAMIEKTQQQAVHAKRQLESDIQTCREELQKEREAAVKLRAVMESLQSQKQQLDNVLEQQKERELRLQKERDQYQAQVLILQEKERTWIKDLEQEAKRLKQSEASKAREEQQDRRVMDLQLQHERDRRRIQELQQMLADLEEQERAMASRRGRLRNDSSTPPQNVALLATNMQRVWQQLIHTVLQVKKWVQNKNDRTHEVFPDEAEVTALLESLLELKSDLQKGYVQPVHSPSSMVEVLKCENEELSISVSQLTKEKLDLKSQLSKLSKSHQEMLQKTKDQVHTDVVDSVLEAERAVWLREKRLLQIALKHAESELNKATLENKPLQDVPNAKIQRLYRKYLRAESFRKALVYQKKYLLLLLGGFQACEKATLSLIARMGVYPSPVELQSPSKCKTGLGKFRSAVRAVIAISRLKFLVRKWHKVSRKSGGGGEDSGTRQVPGNRMDILQPLGATTLNSPPTRDQPFSLCRSPNTSIGTIHQRQSPWQSPKWAAHSPSLTPERSHHSSQDPDHSITEYIQHLEIVQRRLGGLQIGQSPEQMRGKYPRK
ncbi:pericentrin isoform X2 [Engystomops pustulosus]|uniref:pericentrin isoform X2 n=1 Tax=Engystomops pustulosus TaxID=76066 RepID=UPI003AFA029D